PGLAQHIRNAGFAADIGERSVAIIVEQPAPRRLVCGGHAIKPVSRARVSTKLILRFVEINEAANKQIQLAVVVVVEPDGARCPAWCRDTCFLRNVGKSPVLIVAVKNASSVLSDVEIGPAVAVVVADGHAHAVSAAANSRFFGNVGESAITIVVVERIAQRRIGRQEIAGPAVHQVDVHPTVIVVIEKSAAGAGCFGKVIFRRASVYVAPGDPAHAGRHFFKQRTGSGWGRERGATAEYEARIEWSRLGQNACASDAQPSYKLSPRKPWHSFVRLR